MLTLTMGQNIFVTGNLTQLGSWAPASSVSARLRLAFSCLKFALQIALSSAAYPVWQASVSVPAGVTFQYKYIRKTASGGVRPPVPSWHAVLTRAQVVWESDPNRSATAPSSGSITLNDSWR